MADPSGSWEPSSAQQYIDGQIANVTTSIASETIARQTGDRNLQTQLQSEMGTRADQDANLNALINAGIREGGGVQFDVVPTQNSANGITSGGMYSTLRDSNVGFVDDEPTPSSNNLVKSGGVISNISKFSETMFENDLMSKVLSHDVLVANGVMYTIPTYNGYCTDYIRVSKGEKLIVDLYPITTNPGNGWGVLWGYADKNGGSPVNLLPSPNSDMYNAVVTIPDGVNYIRACSKPFPYEENRKPCVIPLVSFLKNIGVVNLGNNVLEDKYLIASGAQQTNANYRGFITGYIPVNAGEKYYIKGSTTYVQPPTFNGNIFAYADKSTSNVTSLGSLSEKDAFTIVEIPEGYNYLRVCARQNVSPYGIIIIKVTEHANVEILNSLFQEYIKTNNEALQTLENKVESDINDIRSEIESLDCSDINNGEPVVYKTINDLNFAASVLVQSYDLENDVFTLYHKGSSNSSLITDIFTPGNSSLLHIKGHVDSITLTGGAPGISIFVANGTSPSGGKYKKLAILSENGDFDITVDISYLIVHEQFTANFYVWLYNDTIPTTNGEVTCTISGFKVLEYNNTAGGTNISGSSAHELFNSIDNQFSDIKQEINELSGNELNELVAPNGSRYILSVSNNGTLVVIPVIPNKAAFFGNSLILSFGTFGMAASEVSNDYYSLITNFILSKNPNFTAHPRMRGADFEFLETTDATQVNQRITSDFLDHLDGNEDLIVIQLGDNVNNAARVSAFAQNIYTLLRAIRNKCQSARVVWMGMWYPSVEKYTIIENGCKGTGCEYVLFDGLRTTDAQNVIGGVARYENAQNWTVNNVVSLTENTSTNITFTFTVSGVQYTSTIDVITYSYSGTTLTYNGYYRVIQDSGVASHPSNEGMRRIANRFLYQMKISDKEETYE